MPTAEFYTFEYMTGQLRPTQKDLLADFDARSKAAAKQPNATLDISYGAHPREKLDIFKSVMDTLETVVYFHPGYWQSRDKGDFRFLGAALANSGYNTILANYPLCPEVTLDELVESAVSAIRFIVREGVVQASADGLIAAGHSAGGHIAAELALRDWPTGICGGHPIRRIVAISGIYDLEPLVLTPLNDKLRLSPEDARRNSPLFRARDVGIPATFVVGGAETSEFHRQSNDMCSAWKAAGNQAAYIQAPGADHFSVIDDIVAGKVPPVTAALQG